MLKHQRAARRLERRWRRHVALDRLWDLGPSAVMAGLSAEAKAKGWKPGWAYYAFVEIYNCPPRPIDRTAEPQPNPLIEEWVATRTRKPRARRP